MGRITLKEKVQKAHVSPGDSFPSQVYYLVAAGRVFRFAVENPEKCYNYIPRKLLLSTSTSSYEHKATTVLPKA